MSQTYITLIDPNDRRRAAINAKLYGNELHVEPRSSVSDLPAPGKCEGIFLAVDEADVIESLMDHLQCAPKSCAVVALSEEPQLKSVVRAMRAGVTDYISWPSPKEMILPAIEAANRVVRLRDRVDRGEARARLLVSKLTKRELEVIHAVSLGWTSKEIASSLGISYRTVEIHRCNALKKMDANNSSEAVRILQAASSKSGI